MIIVLRQDFWYVYKMKQGFCMAGKIRSKGGFAHRMVWQGVVLVFISFASAIFLNMMRQDGLTLPGDWSDKARLTLDSGENLMISLDDAKKIFQARQAVFLDARPRAEYDAGHIQGARSLPWDSFDEQVESVMSDIGEQTTLITYCDGPTCNLSHELAMALIDMGYPTVRVLVNGWTVWQNSRLPSKVPSG